MGRTMDLSPTRNSLWWLVCVLTACLVSGCASMSGLSAPVSGDGSDYMHPTAVSRAELEAHVIEPPPTVVTIPGESAVFTHATAGTIRLREIVGIRGQVVYTDVLLGPKDFYTWLGRQPRPVGRYRPFTRNGEAVYVAVDVSVKIEIKPAILRPDMRIAFPAIKDWSSLRISLHRRVDGPYTSPDYGIEIHGDGTVIYRGNAYVAVSGERVSKIPQKDVRYLYDLFRRADYFRTFDRYDSHISDAAVSETSISFDGVNKSVLARGVTHGLIPESVLMLEDEIDRISHSGYWLIRAPVSVPPMKTEDLKF